MQLCFPIIVMIYGVGAPIGSSCTGDTPGLNATIELLDNDVTPPPFPVVSVTASDNDAREISALSNEPQNPGAFTLTRTAPATNDLTVYYSVSQSAASANPSIDHVAVNGVDYERLSGVAIIPAGSLSTTIPLNPIFDTWLEGNETATLTLLPATNSSSHYLLDTGAINTATVTIRDFAPTNIPIVSIKAIDAQAYEQNVSSRTGTFLITRHGGVAGDLTLNYSISGEASNGVDYVALPGFVTLQASNSTATITIDPIADAIAEPVETVAITIPPAPIDIFPPPYLLGTALTLYNSAGVIIRDQLPPLDGLSRRQRIVWLRRHHHVIVPLPVVSAPAPTTNEVAVTWSVEASSDLTAWQEIGTAEDPDEFVDVDAGDAPKRFYRFRNLAPIQR